MFFLLFPSYFHIHHSVLILITILNSSLQEHFSEHPYVLTKCNSSTPRIDHKHQLNVGEYTIHGSYGLRYMRNNHHLFPRHLPRTKFNTQNSSGSRGAVELFGFSQNAGWVFRVFSWLNGRWVVCLEQFSVGYLEFFVESVPDYFKRKLANWSG